MTLLPFWGGKQEVGGWEWGVGHSSGRQTAHRFSHYLLSTAYYPLPAIHCPASALHIDDADVARCAGRLALGAVIAVLAFIAGIRLDLDDPALFID